MKDLAEVLTSIAQHSISDDDFQRSAEIDALGFCTWCYERVTSNIHLCDCSVCGAPFGYCTHPSKWKARRLQ